MKPYSSGTSSIDDSERCRLRGCDERRPFPLEPDPDDEGEGKPTEETVGRWVGLEGCDGERLRSDDDDDADEGAEEL